MATNIVKTFWPLIDDSEVIDTLFERIEEYPNIMAGSPSIALAQKHFKGAPRQVSVIAANPQTDTAVLGRYATDPRVFVRNLLIVNPNTPYASLLKLADWAVKREDRHTRDPMTRTVIARLTLSDAIETLSRHIHSVNDRPLGGSDLAVRCCEEPELALKLAALKNRDVNQALANLINNGRIVGVTLQDLEQVDPDHISNILHTVLTERGILTMDLAQLWLTWTANGGRDTSRRIIGSELDPFLLVDIEAANALVAGNDQQLRTAIVAGADNNLVQTRVENLDINSLLYITTGLKQYGVSVACELAIAERFLAIEGWKLTCVHVVLEALHHPLPDDVLLRMLCPIDTPSIRWWLQQERHVNGVRPGLLTKLWQDAEIVNLDTDEQDYRLIASTALSAVAVTPFLLKEVIPLCDQYIGTHLSLPEVAKAIHPILAKSFKGAGKVELWNTFFALGDEWSCSFSALIQAVHDLTGIAPEPDLVEEDQLQMSFY